eukprot:CAMPEP_0178762326 /NCGR_PEP_ID=MMETSP0744-20121128/16475_1 /TAXON_ID=913974 /ORGANISM="Nitzschia punctata, Strain CCMP561" /LENGTH=234 /DNA_ID=CAMNT_0020416981 /DNA_START=6 /DNA_END=711 /DNA_ORIENTATION=+
MTAEDQNPRISTIHFKQEVDAVSYGSILDEEGGATHEKVPLNTSVTSDVTYDPDEVDSYISSQHFESDPSFHLGKSRVSTDNVFTSIRRTPSFEEHGKEYQLVPTKLKQNMKLVTDPNLHDREQGRLYYARYSIYNNSHEPKYALTVNTSIYRDIMMEVNDAYSTPCGLYFCCHGGDAAHTGVSHEDYVSIQLAWFILGLVVACLACINILVPWPEQGDIIANDDWYGFLNGSN